MQGDTKPFLKRKPDMGQSAWPEVPGILDPVDIPHSSDAALTDESQWGWKPVRMKASEDGPLRPKSANFRLQAWPCKLDDTSRSMYPQTRPTNVCPVCKILLVIWMVFVYYTTASKYGTRSFNVGVGRWTVAQHPWRLQKCLGHHWHSTKRCTSADKPSPTGAGKSLGRQSSEAQRVLTSDHERYLRNKTNLHANVSPIIAHTCICLQGLISYLMFPSTNHFGFIISSASQIVQ